MMQFLKKKFFCLFFGTGVTNSGLLTKILQVDYSFLLKIKTLEGQSS